MGDDQPGGDDDDGTTPSLNVAIDKTSFTADLGTDNVANVTLSSVNGFTGNVTITPSVVDSANAAITDWKVVLDNTSVSVPANGTVTVKATVSIPSLYNVAAGTLKLDVSAGELATKSVTSTFNVTNQYTFVLTENAAGQCVYPNHTNGVMSTLQVKVNTKLRWFNMTNDNDHVIIHIDGGGTGLVHQDPRDPATDGNARNTAFEETPTTAGTADWYCHSPGPNESAFLKIDVVN